MSDIEDDFDKPSSSVSNVIAHYSSIPKTEGENRRNLRSIKVRYFNNYIKSTIISEAIQLIKGNRKSLHPDVLDICGGRGGDLRKWEKGRTRSYVCVDVVEPSIREAHNRLKVMQTRADLYRRSSHSKSVFPASFIVSDVGGDSLDKILPSDMWFDVVSCQFAAHYMFDFEKRAHQFFENVSSRLRQGGVAVLTVPNSDYIVKKTRESLKAHSEGFKPPQGMIDDGHPDVLSPGFGSSLYGVVFPPSVTLKKFGTPYTFWLADAIAVCEEYLIHPQVMCDIARSYGLELDSKMSFAEILENNLSTKYGQNEMKRMKVFDMHETHLSQDAWELAHFYILYRFRKVKNCSRHQPSAGPFESVEHLSLFKIHNQKLEEMAVETADQIEGRKEFVYDLQDWEMGDQDDWKQTFPIEIPKFEDFLNY
ncbi:hypothetical protein GEMRC1_006470 [Eukaryota sp. GEM-RC1]